jgi:hypothetical protein
MHHIKAPTFQQNTYMAYDHYNSRVKTNIYIYMHFHQITNGYDPPLTIKLHNNRRRYSCRQEVIARENFI